MKTEILQTNKKKEAIMPTSLTEAQLRELYSLAVSCCGKYLNSNPSSQISFGLDVSPQRMRMAVSVAMQHSPYFKSCISKFA